MEGVTVSGSETVRSFILSIEKQVPASNALFAFPERRNVKKRKFFFFSSLIIVSRLNMFFGFGLRPQVTGLVVRGLI